MHLVALPPPGQVLLFSDNIHSLNTYCERLDIPNLHGKTDNEEREALLGCFRGDEVTRAHRGLLIPRGCALTRMKRPLSLSGA